MTRDIDEARIERTMLELLAERGTATACPSEVARRFDATDWRARMPAVRTVAARLQRAGKIDAYQHGRPVDVARARGPIRLRVREAATIDYRAQPERYVVGRGEQGVLTVEPYKSELLPLWRFRTLAIARESAAALRAAFERYRDAGDFVGMDMARKYLQMGWTRARRYANRRSGRKWDVSADAQRRTALRALDPDLVKAEIAQVFRVAYERVIADPTYAGALAARPQLVATRKKQQKEPWEKPAPKKSKHTKLSAKSKASAKAKAKRSGRRYPSLVDNMNAAKKQKSSRNKKKQQRSRR